MKNLDPFERIIVIIISILTILMIVVIGMAIWAMCCSPSNTPTTVNTYTPSVHLMPNGNGGFSTYIY